MRIKMRVSREAVIRTASELIDEKGLYQVALKDVADKLGIRTPSLYNHIDSLDELLHEVAHAGMRAMNTQMMQSVLGKTAKDALKAAAVEYLNYMILHPGIYETIQWISFHGTKETEALLEQYHSLLQVLVRSCDFPSEKTSEIVDMFTGLLHGYTTQQLGKALKTPDPVRRQLCLAIDALLTGIPLVL